MKRFADIFAGIKGWGVGAPAAGALLLMLIFGAVFARSDLFGKRLPFGAQVAGVGAAFSTMTSGAHDAPEVDNSAITEIDLEHFDANMTIADVTEDTENYFVAYRYDTFSVEGSVWKEISKNGEITIAKSAIFENDLKKYAIEQLRQVVESDLAYLKRVQVAEIASNRNRFGASALRGLKGFVIPTEDVVLPVPVPAPALVIAPPPTPDPPVESALQAAATPLLPSASPSVELEITATTTGSTATTTVSIPATLEVSTTTPVATTTESNIVSENSTTATTTAPTL